MIAKIRHNYLEKKSVFVLLYFWTELNEIPIKFNIRKNLIINPTFLQKNNYQKAPYFKAL